MKKLLFLFISLFLITIQAMEQPKKLEIPSEKEFSKSIPKKATYYDILNINPRASMKKIETKYYLLKAHYDPSRFVNGEITERKAIEKINNKLDAAYSTLSDQRYRKVYDRYGEKGIENYNIFYTQGKQLRRKQTCEIKHFQAKTLDEFEKNISNVENLKTIVINALKYYIEKSKQKIHKTLFAIIKSNIAILCYNLAECLTHKSLYDDAIHFIDYALKVHNPEDEFFPRLQRFKEQYIQQKNAHSALETTKRKSFFAIPTKVYRPKKRTKIDATIQEKTEN